MAKKAKPWQRSSRPLSCMGEAFGAEKMVPITNEYGHTVISFGIGVMTPVYELYDRLFV